MNVNARINLHIEIKSNKNYSNIAYIIGYLIFTIVYTM
jgi:hypothetical protein